jgi:hypothetical protein
MGLESGLTGACTTAQLRTLSLNESDLVGSPCLERACEAARFDGPPSELLRRRWLGQP